MVEPGVERQAECCEAGQPRPELRLPIEMRPHIGAAVADDIARIPAGRVAHAAKPPAARSDMRLEHRLDLITQGQIGVTDDAGGHPDGSIAATRTHRGDAGDKLRLADWAHLGRTGRAVHRTAFEKYRGDDVVPGGEIGARLVEEIAMVRTIPEVMMGVDDRQRGIEDRFAGLLCEPGVVWRRDGSSESGG